MCTSPFRESRIFLFFCNSSQEWKVLQALLTIHFLSTGISTVKMVSATKAYFMSKFAQEQGAEVSLELVEDLCQEFL